METSVQAESQRLNYFWLCHDCCRTMTIVNQNNNSVVVPLHPAQSGGNRSDAERAPPMNYEVAARHGCKRIKVKRNTVGSATHSRRYL